MHYLVQGPHWNWSGRILLMVVNHRVAGDTVAEKFHLGTGSEPQTFRVEQLK